MYKIRKAYQDDFEKVYPLFQYFNNDKLRKDDWAALFKPICRELNIGFYGFVCENINDNEIIGFLGGISSIREFNGNSFKICSLTSLVLKPEYRKQNLSFKLIESASQLEDFHIQVVSPISKTIHLYESLGFKINQTTHKTILPAFHKSLFNKNVKIHINNNNILLGLLSVKDKKIYKDHQLSYCNHIIIKDRSEYCYLVIKPTDFTNRILLSSRIISTLNKIWHKLFRKNIMGNKIKIGLIHYVSNPQFFSKNILNCSYKICKELKIKGMSVNSIYINKRSFFIINNYLTSFGVYKSDTLNSDDLDTLYSELVLFDLEY